MEANKPLCECGHSDEFHGWHRPAPELWTKPAVRLGFAIVAIVGWAAGLASGWLAWA